MWHKTKIARAKNFLIMINKSDPMLFQNILQQLTINQED